MNTKILKLTALLLIVSGSFACNENEENYPKEISFVEYSLTGTLCQWNKLIYNDSIILINSDEVLKDYITCTDGSYPEIDFSGWTLLVFNAEYCNANSRVERLLLQQLSDNNYEKENRFNRNIIFCICMFKVWRTNNNR